MKHNQQAKLRHIVQVGIVLAVIPLVSGCSSHDGPQYESKPKRTYRMATRQLPPEPTYGAVRWVRPPQMTPSRKPEASKADLVIPIYNFNVQNKPLKEVILVLAATAGYRSYCASNIAGRTVSITTLGTMDEIAKTIEKVANIEVVIDHQNKEVRFFPAKKTPAKK